MPNLVKAGRFHDFLQDAGKPLSPLKLAVRIGDHILAQFDQGMGKAAPCGVAIQRVTEQFAGIGNVLADHRIAFGLQRIEQGLWPTRIAIPQNGGLPGPWGFLEARCNPTFPD